MTPDFIVHDATDSVGVAARQLEPGQNAQGWVMETDGTVTVTVQEPIALGHKIALVALGKGDTVIKYGQDMGRVIADVAQGGHVHVHNTKTKRW